jgi:hypothetical protein
VDVLNKGTEKETLHDTLVLCRSFSLSGVFIVL